MNWRWESIWGHRILSYFYNRQNSARRTVSVVPGEENYQIATPAELFPTMEQHLRRAGLLADFFGQCSGTSRHCRKAGFHSCGGNDEENERYLGRRDPRRF